jgi:glucose/arabinose dehydrogenase
MKRLAYLVTAIYLCAPPTTAHAQLRTRVHVSGLNRPVAFVQDPSDRSVQFVAEQGGRIRVVKDGVLLAEDFLDLTSIILDGPETGLLGMAFAPDSVTSRRLFVNFIDIWGDTVIARFRRSANPLVVDVGSRFDIRWPFEGGLGSIWEPYGDHNGGHLAFGPDAFLYIGMGDGGGVGDPDNRAQTPSEVLGKMLRIDVSVPDADELGYKVPSDNPFVNGGPDGVQPEIWSFGLRNPWRYSFDEPARGGTGALIIADVGQNGYEEVNYQPAGVGGQNYGWRIREGAHDNDTSMEPVLLPLVDPTYEYAQTEDRGTVIGGFVYRGQLLGAAYQGRYFFADFMQRRIWSLGLSINPVTHAATVTNVLEHTAELGVPGRVTSFGVDSNGELYLVDYTDGTVFEVMRRSAQSDFDADHRSEIAVYRPPTGDWLLRDSSKGYGVGVGDWRFQWGLPNDVPLPADFDGDGTTDLAVYRPGTGEWFIRNSSRNYVVAAGNWYWQWGLAGDTPIAADFDGDGKADITVYRPATGEWFIRYSSRAYVISAGEWYFQWGLPGDSPIPADFDGDRKADIAVFRSATGEWLIRRSAEGYVVGAGEWYYQWGQAGDRALIADFDGDRKADVSVYRPSGGLWLTRYSSLGYAVDTGAWLYQWGFSGDVPVVLDFDGDGKAELTVYRPSTGEWFIRYSTAGYAVGTGTWFYQWGLTGDLAIPPS